VKPKRPYADLFILMVRLLYIVKKSNPLISRGSWRKLRTGRRVRGPEMYCD